MILFVSKRLSEHKSFTKLLDLFILTTRKTFYTIDNDFIYKKLALDILAYLGLMKEQTNFVGYGSFLGLFNYLKDDCNIKFNNKEYTIPSLVENLKVSLEDIIPFELIFLKNLSLIANNSNSNILIIEEDEQQTLQLLSKLDPKSVLRLDISDKDTDPESFESLLKLQRSTSIIPINVTLTEKHLAEVVIMLCSLINPQPNKIVDTLNCSIEKKGEAKTSDKGILDGPGPGQPMEVVVNLNEANMVEEDQLID